MYNTRQMLVSGKDELFALRTQNSVIAAFIDSLLYFI